MMERGGHGGEYAEAQERTREQIQNECRFVLLSGDHATKLLRGDVGDVLLALKTETQKEIGSELARRKGAGREIRPTETTGYRRLKKVMNEVDSAMEMLSKKSGDDYARAFERLKEFHIGLDTLLSSEESPLLEDASDMEIGA